MSVRLLHPVWRLGQSALSAIQVKEGFPEDMFSHCCLESVSGSGLLSPERPCPARTRPGGPRSLALRAGTGAPSAFVLSYAFAEESAFLQVRAVWHGSQCAPSREAEGGGGRCVLRVVTQSSDLVILEQTDFSDVRPRAPSCPTSVSRVTHTVCEAWSMFWLHPENTGLSQQFRSRDG